MRQFQASVFQDNALFVAQSLEIDLTSQGETAEEALSNLREAIELFFEVASPQEINERFHDVIVITGIEAAIG